MGVFLKAATKTGHKLQLFITSLIPELSPLGNQSVIHHYLCGKRPKGVLFTHSQKHTGIDHTNKHKCTQKSADTLEVSLPIPRHSNCHGKEVITKLGGSKPGQYHIACQKLVDEPNTCNGWSQMLLRLPFVKTQICIIFFTLAIMRMHKTLYKQFEIPNCMSVTWFGVYFQTSRYFPVRTSGLFQSPVFPIKFSMNLCDVSFYFPF